MMQRPPSPHHPHSPPVDTDLAQAVPGLHNLCCQRVLGGYVLVPEGGGVLIKLAALRHNLHAQLRLAHSANLRGGLRRWVSWVQGALVD